MIRSFNILISHLRSMLSKEATTHYPPRGFPAQGKDSA
jgi:hypothetical protein